MKKQYKATLVCVACGGHPYPESGCEWCDYSGFRDQGWTQVTIKASTDEEAIAEAKASAWQGTFLEDLHNSEGREVKMD